MWSECKAEDKLSDLSFHYSILIKRVVTGLILGTLTGAAQIWFLDRDLMYLVASAAAGALYMGAWVLFTDWLRLAGGKIFLGAVAGLLAAVVWWAMAVHADDVFLQATVAGMCFGAAYAWSDQRMT